MTDPGLVVVDKPAGITSHDVVARVRRLAGTRKVGHAGTLDPMATGVLVVGVERATRLLGHLMLTDKAYDATIRLGVATTTDDAEGDVVATASTADVDEPSVRATLAAFVGDLLQVPTAVSAIKVDGKRAYQRVRDGEQVELSRDLSPSASWWSTRCEPAGRHGRRHIAALHERHLRPRDRPRRRRPARGRRPPDSAAAYRRRTLRTRRRPDPRSARRRFEVLPIATAARAAFPSVDLDDAAARDVRVGRALDLDLAGLTAVFAPDGEFLALYEPRDGRRVPSRCSS